MTKAYQTYCRVTSCLRAVLFLLSFFTRIPNLEHRSVRLEPLGFLPDPKLSSHQPYSNHVLILYMNISILGFD